MTSAHGPQVVIRIDLRAAATGPGAMKADTFGPETLIAIQREAVSGDAHGSRFVDVGRVLVIDDTDTIAKHAAIYQELVTASTLGRLLCVVIGAPVERTLPGSAPGEPVPVEPAIELPTEATSTNSAVLWVGDPRGVGWRLGMLTATRLPVGDPSDPDGTAALADLVDTLAEYQIFDRMFGTISELSGRVAAPATLPTIRWRDLPRPAGRPPAPPEMVVTQDSRPTSLWLLLLALGCALIALIPPWEVALAVWVVVLASASLMDPGRPRRGPPSWHAAVVAAVTIGSVAGAIAAAAADPLGHLGVQHVAADCGSAILGAIALAAAAFIWRSGAKRHRRGVRRLPAGDDGAVPPLIEVEAPDGPEEDPAVPLTAIITAAGRTVSAGADDEDFLQLNAPEHLALLEGGPQQARLVAFAPEAARKTIMETMAEQVVGNTVAGNDVEWTTTGDRIGIIRLVSVRPGVLWTSEVTATSAQKVVAIDVTSGGDRVREMLAKWLHDDELDTHVLPSDDSGPIAVRLPNATAASILTEGITYWLRGRSDETAVMLTRPDGNTETLTAADVKTATDDETDDNATRIANWLMSG